MPQHDPNVDQVRDEHAMQELLFDLLDEHASDEPDLHVQTFEQAGVLTLNRGLVVTMPGGAEFQVTVVKSTEGEGDRG